MPSNPNKRCQGGDVEGTTTTDVGLGTQIQPLTVAKASYDGGYDDEIEQGYGYTDAEKKLGYASYGRDKIGGK